MARATFNLDTDSYNKLVEVMKDYEGDTERAINEVLWNEGGTLINDAIMNFLPVSGRNWKGKKPAAKSSAPFIQVNENLSVTLKTKSAYNYLYFPDDGTNTRKHIGEQHFMFGGAENQQEEILNRCIAKLTENFN